MKAKLGFVLFIFVFLIFAAVVPLLQGMLQSFSTVGERCIQGTRFVAKKISVAEVKNFLQKAS